MQVIEINGKIINLEEIEHAVKLLGGARIFFKSGRSIELNFSNDEDACKAWIFLKDYAFAENDMVVFDPDEDYSEEDDE